MLSFDGRTGHTKRRCACEKRSPRRLPSRFVNSERLGGGSVRGLRTTAGGTLRSLSGRACAARRRSRYICHLEELVKRSAPYAETLHKTSRLRHHRHLHRDWHEQRHSGRPVVSCRLRLLFRRFVARRGGLLGRRRWRRWWVRQPHGHLSHQVPE
jgi:hypothetical protein